MPNVKKIRGLNLPGIPWACPGLLRQTFTFTGDDYDVQECKLCPLEASLLSSCRVVFVKHLVVPDPTQSHWLDRGGLESESVVRLFLVSIVHDSHNPVALP